MRIEYPSFLSVLSKILRFFLSVLSFLNLICLSVLSEMTTNSIEIGNKLVSPKKMKMWMMIAEDAVKRKITDPKQIVFYYSKGKKAKSVNDWKENITYKVADEELEY